MWNNSDEEDDYNYSPNELAELSVNNPTKYRDMVNSNLDEGDNIRNWEERNRKYVQSHLKR